MILHYTAGNKGNLSDIGDKLASMKDGEYVIEITPNRPVKSLSSLKYLFGVVYKEMAIETGHATDEIHEMMKYKFLAQVIEFPNGVHAVTIGSTKAMTDAEMAKFTSQVKDWAEKFLQIKFTDSRDVDYQKWSELRDGYDKWSDARQSS